MKLYKTQSPIEVRRVHEIENLNWCGTQSLRNSQTSEWNRLLVTFSFPNSPSPSVSTSFSRSGARLFLFHTLRSYFLIPITLFQTHEKQTYILTIFDSPMKIVFHIFRYVSFRFCDRSTIEPRFVNVVLLSNLTFLFSFFQNKHEEIISVIQRQADERDRHRDFLDRIRRTTRKNFAITRDSS